MKRGRQENGRKIGWQKEGAQIKRKEGRKEGRKNGRKIRRQKQGTQIRR